MIRKFGQRAAVAVVATALAASGTALFGATALAAGHHGSNHSKGGSGGKGGTAQSWCLIPIAGGVGLLLGNGSAQDNRQCNANVAGGSGGHGASY